jgi:hypothetical protein
MESTTSAAMSRDAIVRKRKPKGSSRRKVRTLPLPTGLLEAGSVLMPCVGQVKDRERVCSGSEEGVLTKL